MFGSGLVDVLIALKVMVKAQYLSDAARLDGSKFTLVNIKDQYADMFALRGFVICINADGNRYVGVDYDSPLPWERARDYGQHKMNTLTEYEEWLYAEELTV